MIDFLTAVWPTEIAPFVEIRLIRQGIVTQKFYDPNVVEDLLEMNAQIASADRTGWDVYFGVLPRLRRGGTAVDTLTSPTVLWADIDAKAMAEPPGGYHLETQKREAWYRLTEFIPEPSIIVDSGNGYHGYWLLNHTIDWRTAEAIMRAMAEDLGADHVYDAPRILRVPGTHNHKSDPPTPVRLMRFDRDRVYRPGTFADLRDRGIEIMEPPRPTSVAFDGEAIADPRTGNSSLPDWLEEKITYSGGKGGRSEHCFSTILWLIRHGWSDEAIVDVFIQNPDGVGEKFWEKGGPTSARGMRWLQGSINAAKRIA